MSSRKRGTAVNGDLFIIEHPKLALDQPFTSHIDTIFDGVTHQVLSTSGRSGFSYEHVTGEFAVGDLCGHVLETIDTVETQAVHRFQGILCCDRGALASQTYLGSSQLVNLFGALRPAATRLGMMIDPDDSAEPAGPARVAVNTALGVLEVTPLTSVVEAQLPRWRGTPVAHGDLYGGQLSGRVPYLTLVTTTARGVLMLGSGVHPDRATTAMAELDLTWTT